MLSIVINLGQTAEGLPRSLDSLARLPGGSWECLVLAAPPQALELAQEMAASRPGLCRVLGYNLGGSPLTQALAQARGDLVLLLPAGAALPSHLPGLLESLFARRELAGLGLWLQPAPGGRGLAGLAGLELLWEQEKAPWPRLGCLALRRALALETGGLDGTPQQGALELWARWQAQGRLLDWHPEAYALLPQPQSMGGMLTRARLEGSDLFARIRLLRRLGLSPALGQNAMQIGLALLAPALLLGLWPLAPDRAVTLALLAWLLLYPLNRPFLRQVAEYKPAQINQALLYCGLRPFAWLAGMLTAALGRLGGS